MHKFHLGPSRVLSRDAWALRGCRGIRRDSKLPERDGQYEYRIRDLAEAHERMACESELKDERDRGAAGWKGERA